MLSKLSAKFNSEISLGLISLFMISGFGSLKASASYRTVSIMPRNHSSINSRDILFQTSEKHSRIVSDVFRNHNTAYLESNEVVVSKLNIQKEQPNIGGPIQPEMSTYKSVGADNMVSPFTGDFSYNIPLLDVGGYPVNMFYNSGVSMDQEASWVGLGWNINPGTINRNMRGVPDDFDGTKGDLVTRRQSFRPDKTWGVSLGGNVKYAGFPMSLGFNAGISFNNKLGVATEAGIHPSLTMRSGDDMTASLSVGANLSVSSRNGASITPSISLGLAQKGGMSGNLGLSYTYSSRMGLSAMHLNAGLSQSRNDALDVLTDANGNTSKFDLSGEENHGTFNSSISFAYPAIYPSVRSVFSRKSYNLSFSMGGEIYSVNLHGRIGGFYTETRIEQTETKHKAFGVLNYQSSIEDNSAMLDFNRANDGIYTPNSPAIAMPVYTYDVFSIHGEGTGGCFRAYRRDLGFMRDPYVKSTEDSYSLGVDLGFGNTVHGGVELSYVYSPTEVQGWNVNNEAQSVFNFNKNHADYQAVYFKNPGEKTVPDVNFQNEIGGESLVQLKLGNVRSSTPLLLPTLTKYDGNRNKLGDIAVPDLSIAQSNRDKRTQVISFLTAEEAGRIGFNKKIYSYKAQGADSNKIYFGSNCDNNGIDSINRWNDETAPANPIPNYAINDEYRKTHHISEIDILGTDGRKYIYGIPVYNTQQVDVSFSNENGSALTGKSSYEPGTDDREGNKRGRDWFMEQQEMPGYAHSFLLSELISPNYVDVKGDGISEDDMGDAIKFNYSRYHQGYNWRTPIGANEASFSEGLKTDPYDDKSHYIYGNREMWHLYSIESKNMLARFFVKNDRQDCKQVNGQEGGLDNSWGMQRLDRISLYSKGDLMREKNGGPKAKPIKTIKFFQSYKLCGKVDNNKGGCIDINGASVTCSSANNINIKEGKLTLDSIWITYNGNTKKAKNRYVFYYPSGEKNPDYNFNANDRWGNYKPNNNTPFELMNADFPFSVQDSAEANKNAAAWTMNKILLPSGAVITVDYESDSYAYVQDRKAACMYQILGFGKNDSPNLSDEGIKYLYTGKETADDNDYVYINIPFPITQGSELDKKRELGARYFEKITQLFMKLSVKMPSGDGYIGLEGNELISVYGDIADYGLVRSLDGSLKANVAWVRIKRVDNNNTPMVQQVLQFLRQQLPGKAYKGFDVSEHAGAKAVVLALAQMVGSVRALLSSEDEVLKADLKCKEIQSNQSFARLNNPRMEKYGGGLRVKRVVLNDNWDKLKGTYKSTYGQEYKYTTRELINNKLTEVSSGVASWEPSIGAEENPFKEIMRYQNHNKGGPYDFGAIEMPLGEIFYPVPTVGYSRVEVLSIHRDTVKNLPTRQVTEFYTTKDFPYRSISTPLVDGESKIRYEPRKIMQLLKLDMKKSVTLSQGFLVDINDMNGKEKLHATFSAKDSIVSYVENFYNIERATDKTYKFRHEFQTVGSPDGAIATKVIGRDVELMADFRQHKSETITRNYSINLDMFMVTFFPIPLFNMLQPAIREEMLYRSASVVKVVNHYGVLDSVVSIDRGSMISTKNLVYDAETGNVLLTRTQNEHNKPVYNFNYPAHWAYKGMGPAYKNIDAVYAGLDFYHGILINPKDGINDVLESGDELYVLSESGDLEKSPPCDDNPGNTAWTTLKTSNENRIWVVNTQKAGDPNAKFVFMDREGYPYNALKANVRIVRSGHRNMLNQSIGSITCLVDPRVNGQLTFNTSKNIIQTSAATFKDNWRVDNSFYRVDSIVDNSTYAKLKIQKHNSNEDNVNVFAKKIGSQSVGYESEHKEYIEAFKWSKKPRRSTTSESQYKRGFINFPKFTPPVSNAKLFKAYISLYSHTSPRNGISSLSNAEHQWSHGAGSSQHLNILGEIHALKNNWFPENEANNWGMTYLNWYTDQNVSSMTPLFQARTGNEDYIVSTNGSLVEKRVLVTSLINEVANSPLAQNNKIGFRLKLERDNNVDGTDSRVRCFWVYPCDTSSNNFMANCSLLTPNISYYYYQCGDTSSDPNYSNDPYVNTLLRCNKDSITATFCLSKFSRKAINPYLEGVLGNWRVDTSFVYYGSRKETDPSVSIDTRTAGAIDNFQTFWNWNTAGLQRNFAASTVWKWNSTITQYNRKGYEIENKDPLGRFNAGLYGYNQHLPVAVANNSRVREILFDGFEDYDYQPDPSCISCKPRRYFNYESNINNNLDTTQHHTGRNSIKISVGDSITINAPVTGTLSADSGYGIKILANTTVHNATGLGTGGQWGTGLKATYYNHPYVFPNTSILVPGDANSNQVNQVMGSGIGILPYPSPLPYNVNSQYFSVKWEGRIQIPVTGEYKFRVYSDNGCKVKIGGEQLSDETYWTGSTSIHSGLLNSKVMTAGNNYAIEILYYNTWGTPNFRLEWKSNSGISNFETIPIKHLYLPGTTVFKQSNSITTNCVRLDSVQVKDRALTDTFSLLQDKKMVLSAWVKEIPISSPDCKCSSYVKNKILLSYTGSSETMTLKPSGNIIEGWQRYDTVFVVPHTANSINISMQNESGSGANVFFDDIRVYPFNANMKTFVYNSSNLRLMSELDENNFASFFDYDDDGTLNRVKKETEKGIKTISETRSAMQKVIKEN